MKIFFEFVKRLLTNDGRLSQTENLAHFVGKTTISLNRVIRYQVSTKSTEGNIILFRVIYFEVEQSIKQGNSATTFPAFQAPSHEVATKEFLRLVNADPLAPPGGFEVK